MEITIKATAEEIKAVWELMDVINLQTAVSKDVLERIERLERIVFGQEEK